MTMVVNLQADVSKKAEMRKLWHGCSPKPEAAYEADEGQTGRCPGTVRDVSESLLTGGPGEIFSPEDALEVDVCLGVFLRRRHVQSVLQTGYQFCCCTHGKRRNRPRFESR